MTKFSKLISLALMVALLGLGLLTGCGSNSAQDSSSGALNKDVAATVNGVEISMADLDARLETIKQQYAAWGMQDFTEEQWAELKSSYLDDMIDEELLRQAAEKSGVTVDVEIEYQNYVAQYGSEAALENDLETYGYTKESFKAELEKSLVQQAMFDEAVKEVPAPTEAEIAAYYEENKANYKEYQTRHVLFKTTSEDQNNSQSQADLQADGLAKAKAVIGRLANGEDIAEIAKELSDDTGTKEDGGYFAFTEQDSVDQGYKDAVLALKEGEYTQEPVQSQYGYHIIKLVSINDKPLAEVSEEISQTLLAEKQQQTYDEYLAGLKAEAEIVRYDAQKETEANSSGTVPEANSSGTAPVNE